MYPYPVSPELAADLAQGASDNCPLYPNPFPPPAACWFASHAFFTTSRGPSGGSAALPAAPPPPSGTFVTVPDRGALGAGGAAILTPGADGSGAFNGAQLSLGGQAAGSFATLQAGNGFEDVTTQRGAGLSVAFQVFFTPQSGAFDDSGARVSEYATVFSLNYVLGYFNQARACHMITLLHVMSSGLCRGEG